MQMSEKSNSNSKEIVLYFIIINLIMCLEVPALWSIVYSHDSCCLLCPLEKIRFVLIVDIIEAAAVSAILALVQLQFFPILVITSCVTLLFRIVAHLLEIVFCSRIWTFKTLSYLRLTSFILQLLGFTSQILY